MTEYRFGDICKVINGRAYRQPELLDTGKYENDVLVQMTRELTEMLRKNRTIDWQQKETARATMRKMVKRLLKKYKYPPEQYRA